MTYWYIFLSCTSIYSLSTILPTHTHTHTHTHSDDEEIHHIDIQRDGQGFGFSIRGGAEYNAPLCVLRIAEGGAAERDNRLKVGTGESHRSNVMKSNRQI